MKALAKQTSDRYADMGQLLADLVRYEQDFDSETRAMASADPAARRRSVGALVALREPADRRAPASRTASGRPSATSCSIAIPCSTNVAATRLASCRSVARRSPRSAPISTPAALALNAEISQVKQLGAAT